MFNTLYRFDPERETTQINAAKEIGLNISKEEIIEALNKADIWFAKETSKNSMHLMKEKEKDLFYSNYEKTLFNYAGHKITDKDSSILWGFVKNTKRVWLHTCSLDHKNALRNYILRLGW